MFINRDTTSQPKQGLNQWKNQKVIPRLDAGEGKWYREQLTNVGQQLGPYPDDPPDRTRQTVALQWAPWTPAAWNFYRTWTQLRVAPALPTPQGSHTERLEHCPMCYSPEVDLVHILGECEATARFRGRSRDESPIQYTNWALSDTDDLSVLKNKVCAVGLAIAEFKKAARE